MASIMRNRKGVIILLLSLYTCLGNSISQAFPRGNLQNFLELFRSLTCMGLVIGWGVSIRRRILHSSIRTYMVEIAGFMVLLQILRDMRWLFLPNSIVLHRLCWYGYYIPMTFLPALGVLVADCLGKPEGYVPQRWKHTVFIPAILLSVCILMNDVHQWAFQFPNGFVDVDATYRYGPIYSLIVGWELIQLLYILAALLYKSRSPGRKSLRRMPFLILLGGICLGMLYDVRIIQGDFVLGMCLFCIMLCESAIAAGLIRSNTGYGKLFRAATISAQIVDGNGIVCFTANPKNHVQKFGRERCAVISGGKVFWQDDESALHLLKEKLAETQEELSGSNDLLKAEIALKQRKSQVEEKTRLYDRISKDLISQFEQVDAWLEECGSAPEMGRHNLAKICIIAAYIKRHSNLLLLQEENAALKGREAEYCIRESLDMLKELGVYTMLNSNCQGSITAEYIIKAYDCFEAILEANLSGINALLANLNIHDGKLSLRIQLGMERDLVIPELVQNETFLSFDVQEEDCWIDLCLPEAEVHS